MQQFTYILLICFNFIFFTQSFSQPYDFIVANNGSGDFKTVQEAINAVPDFRKKETVIFIKNGVYKEKIVLAKSKEKVTLIGEDKLNTILTYDDYADKQNLFGEKMGTTGSTSFYLFGNDFTANNITFENSSTAISQAVALRIEGDRVVFQNCRFLGNQDTLYPNAPSSRQYYKNCYIEGTIDFIFGWSTAVFEQCEIHSKKSGFITAASTNKDQEFGFVFIDCNLTTNSNQNKVYLGRPWRPYAKTIFLNCNMGKHIRPKGWHNWSDRKNEKTAYYAEYNSKGLGANASLRTQWSHQLSKDEAELYTPDKVLKGLDNWKFQDQLIVK